MSGATAILIKLGVRLVVFTAVFWLAAKKNEKIVFSKQWAPPVVAFVFAILNTVLYWALTPLLDLVTLGAVGFAMPFIVNALLLYATAKIFQNPKIKGWFEIQGMFAGMWMATFLTLAHGVLWFGLDYIPKHV
jgi:uncharacterized membrane protein YvlD (DUF360 family)